MFYNIDNVVDYKPIILKFNNEYQQKISKINKKYLFKKGFLVVTNRDHDIVD